MMSDAHMHEVARADALARALALTQASLESLRTRHDVIEMERDFLRDEVKALRDAVAAADPAKAMEEQR